MHSNLYIFFLFHFRNDLMLLRICLDFLSFVWMCRMNMVKQTNKHKMCTHTAHANAIWIILRFYYIFVLFNLTFSFLFCFSRFNIGRTLYYFLPCVIQFKAVHLTFTRIACHTSNRYGWNVIVFIYLYFFFRVTDEVRWHSIYI